MEIEPAELFRVFPALAVPGPTPEQPRTERDATSDVLVTELRQVIADLRVAMTTCGRSATSGRRRTNASKPRTPPRNASCYPLPQRLWHRTQRQEGRAERMKRPATASSEHGAGCGRPGDHS
jgi:hypothetical protein